MVASIANELSIHSVGVAVGTGCARHPAPAGSTKLSGAQPRGTRSGSHRFKPSITFAFPPPSRPPTPRPLGAEQPARSDRAPANDPKGDQLALEGHYTAVSRLLRALRQETANVYGEAPPQ